MGMFGLSLFDLPFLADDHSLGTSNIPSDSIESYADGAGLTGLNGGVNGTNVYSLSWTTEYFDHNTYVGILAIDSAESYSDGAALNGLNGGTTYLVSFSAGYVNHDY